MDDESPSLLGVVGEAGVIERKKEKRQKNQITKQYNRAGTKHSINII